MGDVGGKGGVEGEGLEGDGVDEGNLIGVEGLALEEEIVVLEDLAAVEGVAEEGVAELGEVDAYLCGPPPMVDAAIAMLDRQGVPESRVYYDKFTTTAP